MRIWNYGTGDKLGHLINLDSLSDLIDEGYITKRKHPDRDLYILNYTNLCAAQNRWNRETVFCRGVVVDKRNKIVARPFPKFFDIDKYPSDDVSFQYSSPIVSEKMDGSLGILYRGPNGYAIASRGSFDSPAAHAGTLMVQRYIDNGWQPQEGFTYLFEIVSKDTSNIVKYRRRERGLYFITAIFTRSGHDIFDFGSKANWPGPAVKHEKVCLQSRDEAKVELMALIDGTVNASKREGLVVYFPNTGIRMKIKSDSFRAAEREAMKAKRRKRSPFAAWI